MMRLSVPIMDYKATLNACIKGITGNNDLKARVVAAEGDLLLAGEAYLTAGRAGNLCNITPIDTSSDSDPVVVSGIVKSELIKLYEYYFVNEKKEARRIYDQILNAAHERCPFCGGIGTPRNLDHFLPKSKFPQFSTLPHNLVPSCRDCNIDGKSEKVPSVPSEQIIQPYLDDDRFFIDQWIFAEYSMASCNMPGTVRYFVRPPEQWEPVQRERARQHFLDFGLAGRYAVKAAEHLGTIEGQIHAMKSIGASNEIICAVLLVPGIEHAPFPNHWQRGMYQALRDHVSANECEQSDSHCDGAKKVFKRESHTSFCAPGAAGSQIL